MATYQAKPFETIVGMEILGLTVTAYKDALEPEVYSSILQAYSLGDDDIQPDGWYPSEIMNDVLKAIFDAPGGSSTLVAMGKSSAQLVIEQAHIEDIEVFLRQSLNVMVEANFRNTPEGFGFNLIKLGDGHYQVTNNLNAPNDMVYGYLWQAVQILTPAGQDFRVAYAEGYSPYSEECATFDVQWGTHI